MSEATHTPGPWVVEEICPDWEGVDIFAPQNGPPHAPDVMIASNVWRGNANLIAAAPELLEVARMVDAWGNGFRHPTAHERKMVEAARADLAKASPSTSTGDK